MFLIRWKQKNRERWMPFIFASAQLAMVAGILLSRAALPGLDFLTGLLMGYSLVGNLAGIIYFCRQRREQDV